MDLLLTRHVLERFQYRLSLSPYRECFVLKGALPGWIAGGRAAAGKLLWLDVSGAIFSTARSPIARSTTAVVIFSKADGSRRCRTEPAARRCGSMAATGRRYTLEKID